MVDVAFRESRFREGPRPDRGDSRTAAQRDRDRLIYSSALRRLAEVTQVVSPDSGYVFHNRLTHTLQVAQVGRRLAERFQVLQPSEVELTPGIDPDVVEAACLAHDLGHPPFGHLAEQVLNEEAFDAGGFEGNAQSFRIATRLAFRSPKYEGLDLTRATLAAVLKYPWLRGGNDARPNKWGAYDSEEGEFHFAREGEHSLEPSLEAQIMNVADDITYSVHDMEDFYRAGLIPLQLLATTDDQERERFFESVFRRRSADAAFCSKEQSLRNAFTDMVTVRFWLREGYTGRKEHRAALRGFTGQLIDRYIRAVRLHVKGTKVVLRVDGDLEDEISMFKELVWTYVIDAPNLATQQVGQRHIVRSLYQAFGDSALSGNPKLFPAFYRERIEASASDRDKLRACVDFVSGLTEAQCVNLFKRISGTSAHSGTEALSFL